MEEQTENKSMFENAQVFTRLEAETDEANLAKSAVETVKDSPIYLPSALHRLLPAELNRGVFLCFNMATQRKFVWRLGWAFYAMFRHRLLKKTKKLRNPEGNVWEGTSRRATFSPNGLNAKNYTNALGNIYGAKGFPISGQLSRMDEFPGTILYYYEVKLLSEHRCMVGLSDGKTYDYFSVGSWKNSYAVPTGLGIHYLIDGEWHYFELPEGATRPERKSKINVYGCGLVLDPNDKLALFFTLNGELIGRQIPISTLVDRLFPTVCLYQGDFIQANFGDNAAKPFKYDIKNCPGMGLVLVEWD